MIHKLTVYGLYFIAFFLGFGVLMMTLDNFEILGDHVYSTGTIVNITATNDDREWWNCGGRYGRDCTDRTDFTFDVEFYDELGLHNIKSIIISKKQLNYDINKLNHKKGDVINLRYTGSPPRHVKLLTDFY